MKMANHLKCLDCLIQNISKHNFEYPRCLHLSYAAYTHMV